MLNLTRPVLRPRRKYFNFTGLKLYQDFRILYKEVARTKCKFSKQIKHFIQNDIDMETKTWEHNLFLSLENSSFSQSSQTNTLLD